MTSKNTKLVGGHSFSEPAKNHNRIAKGKGQVRAYWERELAAHGATCPACIAKNACFERDLIQGEIASI